MPAPKNPAAVMLGRLGGLAGKGSPARKAAAQKANAASPKTGRRQTLVHLPAPGRASGLHGAALCGREAHYATGDHAQIIRQARANLAADDTAHYCQRCLARLARA